jgi:hypothetical protein
LNRSCESFADVTPIPAGHSLNNNDEPKEKSRRRFLLRYHRTFNLEQCELPQAVLDKLAKVGMHEHDPIEAADQMVRRNAEPARDSTCSVEGFLQQHDRSRDDAAAQSVRIGGRIQRNTSVTN